MPEAAANSMECHSVVTLAVFVELQAYAVHADCKHDIVVWNFQCAVCYMCGSVQQLSLAQC